MNSFQSLCPLWKKATEHEQIDDYKSTDGYWLLYIRSAGYAKLIVFQSVLVTNSHCQQATFFAQGFFSKQMGGVYFDFINCYNI